MSLKTALFHKHLEYGGKLVDFAGWEMPVNYGSQMDEHHQVRNDAGMFDVSHMTILDMSGDRVRDFLRYLLANDVARLKTPGKALYSCMLNEQGGVIDDLIVYYMHDTWYRMVVNAATREKDIAWIGRLITKIRASRTFCRAALVCWMNWSMVTSRWLQSLSRMKAMPTFSPEPTKLKPAICIMPTTAGSLWTMS